MVDDLVERIRSETDRLKRSQLGEADRQKLQIICTKAAEELEKKKK